MEECFHRKHIYNKVVLVQKVKVLMCTAWSYVKKIIKEWNKKKRKEGRKKNKEEKPTKRRRK